MVASGIAMPANFSKISSARTELWFKKIMIENASISITFLPEVTEYVRPPRAFRSGPRYGRREHSHKLRSEGAARSIGSRFLLAFIRFDPPAAA
jgi:hypothetical protein